MKSKLFLDMISSSLRIVSLGTLCVVEDPNAC